MKKKAFLNPRFLILFLIMFLFLFFPMLSQAAVITVSTTADNVPGSLRAAIDLANNNGEENVIYLPAGTYLLKGEMNDDQNAHGDLDLFSDFKLAIIGESAQSTIIDANQSDRVFHIIRGYVSMSHVTIRGGSTVGHRYADPLPPFGGGIYNTATLNLDSCIISHNITGPIQSHGHKGGGGGHGGGIYNTGTLSAKRCIIRDNRTADGNIGLVSGSSGGNGGGIMNIGTLVLDRCIIDLNGCGNGTYFHGFGGTGGGIYSSGALNLNRCTISANSSGNGGWDSGVYGTRGGNGAGVYIYEGVAKFYHCTFYENITGNGGIHYSGTKGAAGMGGAIANRLGDVTLASCTITRNTTGEGEQPDEFAPESGNGGGVYNNSGTVVLANTIVAGNTATAPGHGNDCSGDFFSSGYILIQDKNGWTLDGDLTGLITGKDPLLGFPADNGGPTPTCALSKGSPAIDAGSTTSFTDQRGYVRNNPDIGAYEYNAQSGPMIRATPDIINLAAVYSGNHTEGTVLFIDNSGGGSMNWEILSAPSWLICSPSSASGARLVELTPDSTGLAPGTYLGEIKIHCPQAYNSPLTVKVTLSVQEAGTGSVPLGFFDTPLDTSTVMSSVPFTGWALDDTGIRDIKIYRNSVAGENSDWVYVGDATLVEGARPDIEVRYPAYPNRSRAGWGYMMLTNFLPGQGNGQFTFQVRATDVEGHTTILGTKTLSIDNKNALKPFGAVDTPREGGPASGKYYVNFGWALTPQPNTIPMDGLTITVWVDGKAVGHPVYNQYRKDIAALFPGYNNSNGAVGYFYLDTTVYENGVHTIAWSVKDDAGNSDGIGSRYFSIQNSAGSTETSDINCHATGMKGLIDTHATIYTCFQPDTDIQTRECEAFELRLDPDESAAIKAHTWSGYMKRGNGFAPLPTGSILDARAGVFYCQWGPGFTGQYKLIFQASDKHGRVLNQFRKEVTVTVLPKHAKLRETPREMSKKTSGKM